MAKMDLLDRRAVVKELLRDRGRMVVIAGLGASAWDITATGDHDRSLPLWGAMGSSVMIGLGLALAQPSIPVLVITGDGEMLMGIGSLATAMSQAPANLHIAVLDNESYGETGGQRTHTALGVDLAKVASAMGIRRAASIARMADVSSLRNEIHECRGLSFSNIKIAHDKPPVVLPPQGGATFTNRLRVSLLGPEALFG
jgi:thiamine pyrophosphate-dependent acetolactate synthase large subunit-like protein